MIRLPFTSRTHVRAAADAVVAMKGRSGVALLPTETFYGLAVDPADARAVTSVFRLKGRPPGRALPVLAADWDQLERLVEVPAGHRVRLSRTWPGPLTVILPARRPLPAGTAGTLAIRIPGHELLRALLYLTGPLTATSANRHGEPPVTTLEASLPRLQGEPDLALDGGTTPGGLPSTLVDLTGPEPRVLRVGSAPW